MQKDVGKRCILLLAPWSVEVLHALMVLLAFLYHAEILQREEAFHMTWEVKNLEACVQLSLSSRNLPCVLPCRAGTNGFCRCMGINSNSHSSVQTDFFANTVIHVLRLETKQLGRTFSCQIPFKVSVTSCHSLFPQLHSPQSGKNCQSKDKYIAV